MKLINDITTDQCNSHIVNQFKRIPKYIYLIFGIIFSFVIIFYGVILFRQQNATPEEKSVTLSSLDTEWEELTSFEPSFSVKDSIKMSAVTPSKTLKNEDIIVKVVEHRKSTDKVVYEQPLDSHGIFKEQVTEGIGFTISVKSLSGMVEEPISFVISLKDRHD